MRIRKKEENQEALVFEVVVEEGGSSTNHTIILNKEDFNRMNFDSPEELIRRSFEFLLEREPKESILREFNLMDISRYFPEYKSEVGNGK